MAKKKSFYPNKARNQKIGIFVAVFLVACLVGGIVGYGIWDRQSRSWIASIFDERIPIEHFNFNMLEVQERYEINWGFDVWWQFPDAFDIAFMDALDQTITSALAAHKSSTLGVGALTDEQSADVDEWVASFMDLDRDILDFIGLDERGFRDVASARIIFENLFLHFGMLLYDDVLFDEEEMLAAFATFFAENAWEHTLFGFNIIAHDDFAVISDIHDRLLAGEDFYELMRDYSIWYIADDSRIPPQGDEEETNEYENSEAATDNSDNAYAEGNEGNEGNDDDVYIDLFGGIDMEDLLADQHINLWQFWGDELSNNFGQFITNFLLALEVGEFTGLHTDPSDPNIMLIIRLDRYTAVEEYMMQESFREDWLMQGRHTVFNELLEEWIEEANIIINERAFEDIMLFGW
ncbi:MAG: hypothetical protein FWC95_02570 [Defluviitaleaceae bacterium]|nr:hypothetical protein [Defluviitaleaceae bacterium]